MANMLETQRLFYASIFQREFDLAPFVSSEDAFERFDVYRQNIFENLRNALNLTFKGVWDLLGEKLANQAAYTFFITEDNRPKTGCLDDFGKTFPSFLKTCDFLNEKPYIRDYAHYEWLQHQAYGAEDSAAKDISVLQEKDEASLEKVCFSFVPACFLFQSAFDLENAKSGEFLEKETYGLVARVDGVVLTFWLSKDIWLFIGSLKAGKTFLKSVEEAQGCDQNFDLAAALNMMFENQLVAEIN